LFCEVQKHPVQSGPLRIGEFLCVQVRARHFQMGCSPERGMARILPQRDMRGINRDQFPDLCQPVTDVLRQDRVWLLRKLFEHHFHCRSCWMAPCRSHGVLARRSPGFRGGDVPWRDRADGRQHARRCTPLTCVLFTDRQGTKNRCHRTSIRGVTLQSSHASSSYRTTGL